MSKVKGLAEAVRSIPDGAHVAPGGFAGTVRCVDRAPDNREQRFRPGAAHPARLMYLDD